MAILFFRREVFNGDEVICRFGQDRAFVRYDILHGFFSFHFFSFRLGFRFRSFSLEVQFRFGNLGVSVAWGAAVSSFTLRGRPGLRLGTAASLAGAGVAASMVGSWGASTVLGCSFAAGASFCFGFGEVSVFIG